MRCTLMFVSLVALSLIGPSAADSNWPQFRGAHSMGTSDEAGLPDTWSSTKNVVWKTPIPGRGWSSPVVWGDKVFVTSVVREGKATAPKKGLYFGGEQFRPPTDVHRWMVYCLDWRTGKIAWERTAHQGVPRTTHHSKNSYASETPVTDGERVYADFGNLGLFCYDMDGKLRWSQRWKARRTQFGWGPAASPVLYQDRLYIVNDNEERSFLLALDKRTGKEIWRVRRDEKSTWSTPFVWENGRRTEIVTAGSRKVRSYDLDGKLLWELGGMSSITIGTPFARDGLLYVSSGYVLELRRPVYAIRPGATGDITLKPGTTSNEFIAWCQKMGAPYNPTGLVSGGYYYVLYDRGVLGCYDAQTGKDIYGSKHRLGGSAFTASPWAYDGKVFCLSEDGDTFVVQAGPKFKLLGKNSLGEMCLATPAPVRGSLVLRTESQLYRIAKGGKSKE
ncbi:MAG TPA: PQQ-binding-like beta-propeller repeat protein [Gemmataceae bacterium]|jgi:outer membrane protein assembly factor BamB|nr:PQQ-binding-like beta-propeller repeat protein [Gemmataceae bacterium]